MIQWTNDLWAPHSINIDIDIDNNDDQSFE